MSQNSVFTAEKQLFSRICMYWQSHWYYHRIAWFLLILCSIFKLIFTCFGDNFFDAFLRSFLAPFWAADRLFKLTPKSRKTRAKPESVQGPSRGRFWGSFWGPFWGHFGSFLEPFWQRFCIFFANTSRIYANTCRYAQILSNTRKCQRS